MLTKQLAHASKTKYNYNQQHKQLMKTNNKCKIKSKEIET